MSDILLLSESEFTQQYDSSAANYPEFGTRPDVGSAYALYLHYAINGEGYQLFGRIISGQSIKAGFDESVYKNFEPAGHAFNPGKDMNASIIDDPRFKVGNAGDKIMHYLKRWGWTPALNDVWVLANVHARKHFIPISPLAAGYVFSDEFGVSVFGRELLGLALSGYISKPVNGKGTFVPTHNASNAASSKLTLNDYVAKANGLKGKEAYKAFFHQSGFHVAP
jgi:hypothetical protein